jgi:hypothetical protein
MASTSWLQSMLIAALLIAALPLGYLIYRVRRSEDEGRGSPSSRTWLLYIVLGLFVFSGIRGVFFEKLPSQDQIQKRLSVAHQNGAEWQAWQVSHPYAVPLFIFVLCMGALVICLTMLIRTTVGKGWGALFGNILFWFCLAFVLTFGALALSFFRL